VDVKNIHGRTVKVGSRKYFIHVKKSIKKGTLLGQAKHYDEVIEIVSTQSDTSFVDTLLHEILHCIWYDNGIGYALDCEQVEEFVVNSFSSGLISVFMDNPWLIKFINDTIK
jgi:hypothetical protein